jgi:DNA polymerase-3 subunit delta'
MPLKDIFCQDRAIVLLQRAFAADKVPHAYIFAGMQGVGKFRTAREWAKLLLCRSAINENGFADSCGSCQSCRLFDADSHPDFHKVYKELIEFTKDGKGRKTPVDLPIDVVREFLIEKVTTRPTLSERKVFVVGEAEKLNNASQNCLLKVLEEPPQYCCIILLCTRLERLLPTTKSRCQIVRFGPVDQGRIIEKLKETDLDENKIRYFARLAQGSIGRACQWADLELAGVNLYQTKKMLVTSLVGCKFAGVLDLAQKLLDETRRIAAAWSSIDKDTSKTDINRRAQKTFIQIIVSVLYDVMRINVIKDQEIINFDQQEQVKKLAGRFDSGQAGQSIAHCYRTLRWIDSSVNEKLVFEQLLLKLVDSDIIKV